ncbi:MAG: ribonuclease HII [Flavobacteriales bacterium]|nr:ribonuclease HII [Flavobacteriales bacterium]
MLERFLIEGRVECGCDEAGRGCLAGPVVAAAVILPADFYHPLLNDSKKMSEVQRNEVRAYVEAHALHWAVAEASPEEIDEINILHASFLAMHRAVGLLKQVPQHLLIDGNRFKPYEGIGHTCIIKGDGKFASIAAASVLAKTHRDACMEKLHMEFPGYAWNKNKGYPTLAHREAIRKLGPTPYHRQSFTLLPGQLQLEL